MAYKKTGYKDFYSELQGIKFGRVLTQEEIQEFTKNKTYTVDCRFDI